jgi:exosortase D (VPLPA-CTERM-specific)
MQEAAINGRMMVRPSIVFWLAVVAFAILLFYVFEGGFSHMLQLWQNNEEYGHSFFIPFLSLFLVWQKRHVLAVTPWQPSWLGLAVVAFGIILGLVGELSTLYVIVQYASVLTLTGGVLALTGTRVTRVIWAPLLFLAFMVPLPDFLYQQLSTRLQLLSSELGAAIIRTLGISVYVEGNVIDLGVYQLQVVEACNGLRYLFPLVTIAFIAAYFYRAPFWKKAIVFLSSVPIAILMNSFRIGVIGVLVEYSGTGAAEGFLHFFEGWVVFMLCIAILLVEMALLGRIGPNPQPLREVFVIESDPPPAGNRSPALPRLGPPFVIALALLAIAAASADVVKGRKEAPLARQTFVNFPMHIDGWQGRHDRLEPMYIDRLRFDDYLLADFVGPNKEQINLYMAYYGSQRKGQSAHSPRSCIPGGGWEIANLSTVTIPGTTAAEKPFKANRLLIQMNKDRQLVYYWFKQRERVITNEYLVKAWLLWDALTRNRTDGALIRLTSYVHPTERIEDVDRRMAAFARAVEDQIVAFVPD